jgi:hypothetical protein
MRYLILHTLRNLFRSRHDFLLENLALRRQILVLERQVNRCILFLNGMLPPCERCFLSKNILSQGRVFIPLLLYNLCVFKR